MGSVVVTPLYSLYQAELGFSDLTLTLIYGAYVVGNVVALVLFGQVSDQVGRKAAAVPGLVLAALSAVAFLVERSTPWLYAGRVLIGLAVGILSGTGTAWLAEHLGPERRAEATLTATVANLTGIAIGPTLGGVLAAAAPHPLVLPLVVYLVLVVLVAIGVLATPDPRGARVQRLRDVRVHVRLGVPRALVGRFVAPAIAAFVTFALGGLYFSLIPSIVIRDLHVANVAVGGLVVSELAVVAVLGLVLGRRVGTSAALTAGLVAVLPAVVLVVAAQAARSMPLLLLATVFAGLTLSFGYRGSLEIVNRIAPDEGRAEMVSTYFMCCFLGNALPVIGVALVSRATGPITATTAFAVLLAVLATAAFTASRYGSGSTTP